MENPLNDQDLCDAIHSDVASFLEGLARPAWELDEEESPANDMFGPAAPAQLRADAPTFMPSNSVTGDAAVEARIQGSTDLRSSIGGELIARALERLVRSYNGLLPGTAFVELYKLDESYRGAVKAAGGPKNFVRRHPERFTWVERGVIGGSVQLAGARLDAVDDVLPSMNAALGSLSRQKEEKPYMLPVNDPHGYCLGVPHYPGPLSVLGRPLLAPPGLHMKVLPRSPLGWLQAAVESEMPMEDCDGVDSFVEIIKLHGGSLLASKIYGEFKAHKADKFPAFKRVVDAAGGMKKFVSMHSDQVHWVLLGGLGTEAVEVTFQGDEILEEVARLLHRKGGSLLASQILPELKALADTEVGRTNSIKKAFEEAGGTKKYILAHSDRFEWMAGCDMGMEEVRLRTQALQ